MTSRSTQHQPVALLASEASARLARAEIPVLPQRLRERKLFKLGERRGDAPEVKSAQSERIAIAGELRLEQSSKSK